MSTFSFNLNMQSETSILNGLYFVLHGYGPIQIEQLSYLTIHILRKHLKGEGVRILAYFQYTKYAYILRWEGGPKSPKLCLRNIWMVPMSPLSKTNLSNCGERPRYIFTVDRISALHLLGCRYLALFIDLLIIFSKPLSMAIPVIKFQVLGYKIRNIFT